MSKPPKRKPKPPPGKTPARQGPKPIALPRVRQRPAPHAPAEPPRAAEAAPAGLAICAAVCTYNRYDLLPETIDSIVAQSLDPSRYHVVVVDNSPDAELSVQWARRWQDVANLSWVHEKTAGLSRARNIALASTDAPFIAYLDDDAVACKDWLSALLDAFEQLGPDVHVLGGKVRLRFGSPRPDWLTDGLCSYLSACDRGEAVRLLQPHEWIVGANMAYRTGPLRSAGGFSTALGRVGKGVSLMSNDETELADRLHAAGGLTGYTPHAEAEHFVPPERLTQEWFRRRFAWQAVSDFVRNPGEMQAGAELSWERLRGYLASCPPADRTMRALVIPQATPGGLAYQLSAVYETVVVLLSGQAEADVD